MLRPTAATRNVTYLLPLETRHLNSTVVALHHRHRLPQLIVDSTLSCLDDQIAPSRKVRLEAGMPRLVHVTHIGFVFIERPRASGIGELKDTKFSAIILHFALAT